MYEQSIQDVLLYNTETMTTASETWGDGKAIYTFTNYFREQIKLFIHQGSEEPGLSPCPSVYSTYLERARAHLYPDRSHRKRDYRYAESVTTLHGHILERT